MLINGVLVYMCICEHLFDIVILVCGYEQGKVHNYQV